MCIVAIHLLQIILLYLASGKSPVDRGVESAGTMIVVNENGIALFRYQDIFVQVQCELLFQNHRQQSLEPTGEIFRGFGPKMSCKSLSFCLSRERNIIKGT
jgi:hypothetical protein